jgi:hypothetical protein
MSVKRFVNHRKRKTNTEIFEQEHEIGVKIARSAKSSASPVSKSLVTAASSACGADDDVEDQDSHEKKRSCDRNAHGKRLNIDSSRLRWRKITAENLSLDYAVLFSRTEADQIVQELENHIIYNTGQLAQVRLFGKWVDIPRKQVSFEGVQLHIYIQHFYQFR